MVQMQILCNSLLSLHSKNKARYLHQYPKVQIQAESYQSTPAFLVLLLKNYQRESDLSCLELRKQAEVGYELATVLNPLLNSKSVHTRNHQFLFCSAKQKY